MPEPRELTRTWAWGRQFVDRPGLRYGASFGLRRVQLEGKKTISAGDWFLGRGIAEGDELGDRCT
jgi:hypothetical protein